MAVLCSESTDNHKVYSPTVRDDEWGSAVMRATPSSLPTVFYQQENHHEG